MKTIFTGSVGILIPIVLEEDGSPVDITSSTVTLQLKSSGLNATIWSHTATIDDAANGTAHYTSVSGDFAAAGDYYTNIVVDYTSGSKKTFVGEFYNIIQNQNGLISISNLLRFMNIPSENAMPDETIQMYIDIAQTSLDSLAPGFSTSTDPKLIKQKQNLIMLKAATIYFMNLSENNINPDVRIQKIELWSKEFNEWIRKFNDSLSSTTEESSGIVRRVKQSGDYMSNTFPYKYNTITKSVAERSVSMRSFTNVGLGSNCTGLDGASGRVWDIPNCLAAQSTNYLMFRNGALLDSTAYALGNSASGTQVTFTSINIFNDDAITLMYFIPVSSC
jgi:hypothetical protein